VFESLISSDSLQLKTENEAFWLLLAWVEAQSEESEEGKQELFTRMAKHLHFHDMDPGYILLLVSKHPRIIAAGLQVKVLTECLRHATVARRTPAQVASFNKHSGIKLTSSHAPLGKVSWTKHVTFTAADIVGMTSSGATCIKIVGLVAGIPWRVMLLRADNQVRVCTGSAAICGAGLPGTREGGGIFFTYCLEVGAAMSKTHVSRDGAWTNGLLWYHESSGAWEEVFAEGSGWLRDGQLDVKVTITICNDQPTAPPSDRN
jgi:hypothetical protein